MVFAYIVKLFNFIGVGAVFLGNASYGLALGHGVARDGVWLVNAGRLLVSEGDFLSVIADDLIKRDDIHTVVIFSIIGDQIRISARSDNSTVLLHQRINELFGSGGAKMMPNGVSAGGATLAFNLGFWVGRGPKSQLTAEQHAEAVMEEAVFG